MTRLTNEARNAILYRAVASLPKQDFHAEARKIIEAVIYREAPDPVKALLDDATLRVALATTNFYINVGNATAMSFEGIRGVCLSEAGGRYPIKIHMDQPATHSGVRAALREALVADGVIYRFLQAKDTLDNVKRRLRAALYSVNTVKRLYDVLEPEIHHLIPKTDNGNLPAVSVKVVDDLRALGAEIPETAQ
jgi:hypothetical protein